MAQRAPAFTRVIHHRNIHAMAHVKTAEREATHRVISLAELLDVPMLIVHVSAGEAIEQIRWARATAA